MAEVKGIKVRHSKETTIFLIADYLSEDEYTKAWTTLTRKLESEGKWFTADPIMEGTG
jgi:hypothetical protein